MKSSRLTALVLAALLTLPLAGHAAPMRVLEDGIELTPSMLTLPARLDGTVAIQGCGKCQRQTLSLARSVRFYVGKTEVTLADLQGHLRSHPDVSVLVVTPKGQNIVSRIVAADAITR